jgi:head-tail adaptor
MNIVFGGILLLMGAGYLAFYIISPTFAKQISAGIEKQQADQKAARETKLAELKRQEAEAKTKEEQENFKSEREELESTVEPDMSGLSEITGFNIYSDIRLTIYYFSEVTAGILLNLLMIISGVGLLGLAEWSRRLAVAVAWGKILRWVAMMVITMVLVLPITTQKMQKFFDNIQRQTTAKGGRVTAGPMINMSQVTLISGAVTIVFEAIVFSIYPGITIWFLTRPRTRAACMAKLPMAEPVPTAELGGPT